MFSFASAYGIFSGKANKTAVLRFSAERARWVADERWQPNQVGACPLGIDGAFCKHLVATGLAWLSGDIIESEAVTPEDMETIRDWLDVIDEKTLVELISQRARWDENLLAELALAARASRHEDKARETRRRDSAAGRRQTSKSKPSSVAD